MLLDKKLLQLQVTVNGEPACAGILVTGITNPDGSACYTDENGMITTPMPDTTVTVTSERFIDIPARSKTINPQLYDSLVGYEVLPLTSTAGNKATISSSGTQKFSPYVTDFDVACVGAGGSGGGQHSPDTQGYGNGYTSATGGGGGHAATTYNVQIASSRELTFTIGAGAISSNGGTTYCSYESTNICTASGGAYGDTSAPTGNGDGACIYVSDRYGKTKHTNGGNATEFPFGDSVNYPCGGGGGCSQQNGSNKATPGSPYGGSTNYKYNADYGSHTGDCNEGISPGGGGAASQFSTYNGENSMYAGMVIKAAGASGRAYLKWRATY